LPSPSRLLPRPALGDAPRALTGPEPALDAFTRALLEQAQTAAYERGVRDGHAAGARTAQLDHERATAAVQCALTDVVAELREVRAAQAHSSAELALAIAEVVVARELTAAGADVLGRVRDAIAAIDDRPVTVLCAAGDVDALSTGLADVADLAVVADARLAPGDARVVGRWAQADVLLATAWDAVKEVLHVAG
jgi:flagellar biosynthesis/type III secretory pathway protein FliH